MAYFGPSRPRPLSLTPANGIRSTRLLEGSLMWTMPTWRGRAANIARLMSLREDAGGQAERHRVDLRRSPARGSERDHRQHRREDLFAHDFHVACRVPVRMVGSNIAPLRPAAMHHRGAITHRLGHPRSARLASASLIIGPTTVSRGHEGRRPAALRVASTSSVDEAIQHRVLDEQALERRARLAGAAESGIDAARRRPFEIGVVADDASPRCCRAPARSAGAPPIAGAAFRPRCCR